MLVDECHVEMYRNLSNVGCTEMFNEKKKSIKVNFCSEFNFINWLINMIDKADTKVLANIFAITDHIWMTRNTKVYADRTDRDIPVHDSITAAMNSVEKFNKSNTIEEHEH